MPDSSEGVFVEALKEWTSVLMHSSLIGLARHAKANGLSMAQLGTIVHLHRLGACGVTDLSEDIGVTNAAVSQMLDRLVQSGLVARTEDPDDRRSKRVELTARGRRVMDATMEARQHWLQSLARALTENERRSATESLRLLAERTSQLREADG
jgi:DNA-binding MarR family transcriptional regulator